VAQNSSGIITALNGTIVVPIIGEASIVFNVTGTWQATLGVKATVDGINWFSIPGFILATQSIASSFSSNQAVAISCSGFLQVQLIATSFTSGTINVAWASSGAGTNVVSVTETLNIDGSPTTQIVDNDGILFNTGLALHVTDYLNRQIQEQMLLMAEANLLSTELAREKTSRYNFKEIR